MMRLFVISQAVAVGALPSGLESKLNGILQQTAAKYNCSYSLAIRTPDDLLTTAAGTSDFEQQTEAKVTDKYAWGSCTKMHTAASIMKLVSQGVFTLDHTIGSLVDDILGKLHQLDPSRNFSSVEDLWGGTVTNVTIRQLMGMKAGVPDFDTATPSRSPSERNTDPLRAQLYEKPDHMNTPAELMSESWVANHWTPCSSRAPMCYSSTNYILLGFVLAQYQNITDWKDLDQKSIMPDYLKEQIIFATDGTPVSYGSARGFDRTSYNMPRGTFNNHDNGDVKGVFAGWTASNIVSTAAAMANMTWEIFAEYSFAPKEYIDQMIPAKPTLFPFHPFSIYGLGTFNIGMQTGQKGKYGDGYGHLGATYGYQSVSGYHPGLNVVVTIATNIERDNQDQPSDAYCLVYNALAGAMLNQTINCTFSQKGYYGGVCKCDQIKEFDEIVV